MQSTSWKYPSCSPVSCKQPAAAVVFLHVKLPSRGDSPKLLTVFMCQVYFADFLNQRLRKLVKSGTGNDWYIYTVAGTGVSWPIGGFVQNCPSKLFKQQLLFFFPVLFVWKIDVESNRKKRSFIRCCAEITIQICGWSLSPWWTGHGDGWFLRHRMCAFACDQPGFCKLTCGIHQRNKHFKHITGISVFSGCRIHRISGGGAS